jgi:hypothetical protein
MKCTVSGWVRPTKEPNHGAAVVEEGEGDRELLATDKAFGPIDRVEHLAVTQAGKLERGQPVLTTQTGCRPDVSQKSPLTPLTPLPPPPRHPQRLPRTIVVPNGSHPRPSMLGPRRLQASCPEVQRLAHGRCRRGAAMGSGRRHHRLNGCGPRCQELGRLWREENKIVKRKKKSKRPYGYSRAKCQRTHRSINSNSAIHASQKSGPTHTFVKFTLFELEEATHTENGRN